ADDELLWLLANSVERVSEAAIERIQRHSDCRRTRECVVERYASRRACAGFGELHAERRILKATISGGDVHVVRRTGRKRRAGRDRRRNRDAARDYRDRLIDIVVDRDRSRRVAGLVHALHGHRILTSRARNRERQWLSVRRLTGNRRGGAARIADRANRGSTRPRAGHETLNLGEHTVRARRSNTRCARRVRHRESRGRERSRTEVEDLIVLRSCTSNRRKARRRQVDTERGNRGRTARRGTVTERVTDLETQRVRAAA